jgi:hypothetical protein
MEDRQLAAHATRQHVGGHRRSEHVRGEVPLDFLQHEHQPCQRRVERRRQSRPATRREPRLALPRADSPPTAHALRDGAAHLHRGSLTAERQTAADGHHPADELHRQKAHPRHGAPAQDRRFQMGNAAASGLGRQATHQTQGEHGAGGAQTRRQHPAPGRIALRPEDQAVAQRFPLTQAPLEGRCHRTGQEPHQHGAGIQPASGLAALQQVPHLGVRAVGRPVRLCGRQRRCVGRRELSHC